MIKRYAVQAYKYGGWEICDRALEHSICFSHVFEDITRVCEAMNEQNAKDVKELDI